MNIRILVSVAGLDFDLKPGEETSRFSADEAIRLIASGAAVPADPVPPVETAVRANLNRETRRKKADG